MARGKPLSDETMVAVRKMYEEEPNKAKLARIFGLSMHSIYRCLGKVDPETDRERRREAMGRIAGTMTDRIEDLLDVIKEIPENASYQQKMVAIGILSDKVEKLDRRLAESKQEDVIAALPIPETVEAMAAALRSEIRQINFILQVAPAESDAAAEARRIEVESQRLLPPAIEAEVLSIDDLDGAR